MSETPYKNIVIYFWSGTGNSYRLATCMGEIAEQNGLKIDVISIDRSNPVDELKDGKDSLIGFVFPTHGFTAPWHILKFIWSLPRAKSTRTFCVAARAGLKFGSVFVPGISGTATFITALILLFKGYKVLGSVSVDMPSNWFSLHPIQSRKKHEAIFDRAQNKIANFLERILTNGKMWFTLNNLYEITWGIALSYISVAYLFLGRFFLAKLFFANKNCNGCGICEKCCSVGAIKMMGTKKPKPFWKYNCESCMRCSAFCPSNAIEVGHSWAVVLYFISAVPFSAYMFSLFNEYIFSIENLEQGLIIDILNLVYYYPAIFMSYIIFNALIRIPAINWIFTHTTLTHFSFWGRYREPNARLKDLQKRTRKF